MTHRRPRVLLVTAPYHSGVVEVTGHFFRHKFENLGKLSPEKRSFMVRVLKLLIENSYLGDEMRRMAGRAQMPESVRAMLAEVEAEDRRAGRAPMPSTKRKAG